jgi:hypothetical protein
MIRGQTSGRSDDNLASAKKRFVTFTESTLPIVQYFDEKNILSRVRGDQTVELVYKEIKEKVLSLLEKDLLDSTQLLLEAIEQKDFNKYSKVSDANLLAFEEETKVFDTSYAIYLFDFFFLMK